MAWSNSGNAQQAGAAVASGPLVLTSTTATTTTTATGLALAALAASKKRISRLDNNKKRVSAVGAPGVSAATLTSRSTTALRATKDVPNGGAAEGEPPTDDATTRTGTKSDRDVNGATGDAAMSITARYRWSVMAVLAAAFLNLLGFTMAGPITPALGQHFDLPVGASFGSLTSAYPLGMLGGLFVWPSLSDSIGRKPVMVLSLLGSGIGLGMQAAVIHGGGSLGWFLASRVLTGCFAGSSPVSKAFLADVGAASGQLPRYLAWRDASSTMAFIVGPLLGGVALDQVWKRLQPYVVSAESSVTSSLAFVIGISSAASLAAAALIGAVVTDVEPTLQGKAKSVLAKIKNKLKGQSDDDANNMESISCPLGNEIWSGVLTVCLISFLFNVGDSTFHAFFSALLKHQLNLPARSIGLAYTVFACVSFGVSASIVSPAIAKLGPVRVCSAGLAAVAAGLYGLAMSSASSVFGTGAGMWNKLVWPAAFFYYVGVPMYGPTIPTMLLRCVPSNQRGRVMGLDGAINTIARIVAPIGMGWLYQTRGAGTAFGVAAFAAGLGATIALARRLVVLWEQQQLKGPEQQTDGTVESVS